MKQIGTDQQPEAGPKFTGVSRKTQQFYAMMRGFYGVSLWEQHFPTPRDVYLSMKQNDQVINRYTLEALGDAVAAAVRHRVERPDDWTFPNIGRMLSCVPKKRHAIHTELLSGPEETPEQKETRKAEGLKRCAELKKQLWGDDEDCQSSTEG